MSRLFVVCGHGAGDPGACSDGYSEATLVRELAARIKALGGADVTVGDTSRNWYAENLFDRGMVPSGVPVVELHMDSASEDARGAHVIYKAGFVPDAWDEELARRVAELFPGRAQRLVGRSNLQNVNVCARRGINYRLVENGFVSNDADRSTFIEQMDDLARIYLDVFSIDAAAPSQPDPVPTGAVVVDGLWGSDTTRGAQEAFDAPFVDGVVSRQNGDHRHVLAGCTTGWEYVGRGVEPGSQLITILQKLWGAKPDGFMGPDTANAMIRYYMSRGSGATVCDGRLDYPSLTIKAFQRDINERLGA